MRSFASLLRSPAFLKESWAKNFVESFAFLLYEIAPCHGYARPGGIRTTQMLPNFHVVGACVPGARRTKRSCLCPPEGYYPMIRRASPVNGGPGGDAYEHPPAARCSSKEPPWRIFGSFLCEQKGTFVSQQGNLPRRTERTKKPPYQFPGKMVLKFIVLKGPDHTSTSAPGSQTDQSAPRRSRRSSRPELPQESESGSRW